MMILANLNEDLHLKLNVAEVSTLYRAILQDPAMKDGFSKSIHHLNKNQGEVLLKKVEFLL